MRSNCCGARHSLSDLSYSVGDAMRKNLPFLISVLALASLLSTPSIAATPKFNTLDPGKTVTLEQEVPIKIALVGFDENDVDEDALRAQLADAYAPVVRVPKLYQDAGAPVTPRDLGLSFTFEYDIINTGTRFEDAFFGYLKQIGTAGPPTHFQDCYSGTAPTLPDGTPDPCNQTGSVLDIDQSLYIDAPSVEQWLATRGRALLDTDAEHAYFLYFINWYSRDDFQFHVFTKTDEPDPDTGYNFGEQRASRKLRGYGGSTASRIWYFDMSAGPEFWAGSYDINTPDLDGDGEPDYRIPPIWEYAEGGYRPYAELSKDLGLLTRYVGVDLLFTPSPLYDPLVTTPGVGGDKVVDIELAETHSGSSGTEYIDRDFVLRHLQSIEPYYDWQVVVDDQQISPDALRALQVFGGLIDVNSLPDDDPVACAKAYTAFGALFCYFNQHRDEYIPAYAPNDYVAEVFAFYLNEENLIDQFGVVAFADNDYATGTQTYVFGFSDPVYRAAGFGFSGVTTHELGHHIGLSHPHDGYDPASDVDYGPTGPFYFAWNGDFSASIMGYLFVSFAFDQFNRDNLYRYETAGYLNKANALLAAVLAAPNAGRVTGLLKQADHEAKVAESAFDEWRYLTAVTAAYRTYNTVRTAAVQLGVPTEPVQTLLAPGITPSVPRREQPIRLPAE